MSVPVPPVRPLRIIFLVVLMDLVGFGLVLPIMPLYASVLGGGPLYIGLLLSVYSLMTFLMAPVWGRLSDRIGRRPVILFSLSGSVAAYTVYGLAEHLSAEPRVVLGVLFASRLLAGVMAANIATAQAYVADVTTPRQRAGGMGVVGSAIGLGFVLGPALGAAFTTATFREHVGLGAPGFAAAAVCAGNLAWAWARLPESHPPGARSRGRPAEATPMRAALAGQTALLVLLLAFLLTHLAFSQFEATFALLAHAQWSISPAALGLIFSYLGVIVVIMQGGLTRVLVKRLGERLTLIAGAATMGLGMAGVALGPGPVPVLVALGVMAAGFGAVQPSLLALVSLLTPTHRQGLVLGFGQSMGSLARILGPTLGLALYGGLTQRAPYWAAAGCLGVVTLLGAWLARGTLPTVQEVEES